MTNGMSLETFFYPKNVAVIGVSPEKTNLGKNIVRNMLTFGYEGEILSVGVKPGVTFGQRIYSSVDHLDHPVDLAVILTPARTIPDILKQCGLKGIRHVVIESGGFSEMGAEGIPLERACRDIASEHGLRLIGPNGIGVTNLENGLALPFMPLRRDLYPGPVSILAQSGGVGLSYLGFLADENIGLNKFVSMGNKLDVNENDLLAFLIEDRGTEIILVHLEGFTDGRGFIEIASRSKKPILVHKSNRFEASAQIAHSHTAALFADDKLVDQALSQAGCIRVNSLAEAMDCIKILTLPSLKGNRLAVVSRSGGHAVIAADACGHYRFALPPFPQEFLENIERRFRANVIRLQNPLDLGDLFDLDFYEHIVKEMLLRDDVDGVLLVHGYRRGYEQDASRQLIKGIAQLVADAKKPVAVVVFVESAELDYLQREASVPVFSAPENAMRALYLSHQWASRGRTPMEPHMPGQAPKPAAKSILEKAAGRDFLFLDASLALIRSYGFPVPDYQITDNPDDAVRFWQALRAPIAMKVNRPHMVHKTDAGFIRLGLNSEAAIREAFARFQRRIAPQDLELFLQPMAAGSREIIFGAKRDPVFGPVVVFGLGGIFVEALGDVAWRVAPVGRDEARRMIRQIKGQNLLAGIRGQAPCDLEGLEALVVTLSQMVIALPMIEEIDINPVRISDDGQVLQALDARVILAGQTDRFSV
jgi:acetyltransferase